MTFKPLDWDAVLNQEIRIYRNLNNGTMSIQLHTRGKGWYVAGHVKNAIVANVTFKVSESGRQRVIRDKRKNVHAWGQGILIAEFDDAIACPIDLAYDPYTNTTFVERRSQREITRCDFLVVRNNLVFVSADAIPADEPKRKNLVIARRRVPTMFTWQPVFMAA